LQGIAFDWFEGDVIVEAWRIMDVLGFIRQTGGNGRT